jgi:3',5'-cyclic AMP phosphodiesterase CpdA
MKNITKNVFKKIIDKKNRNKISAIFLVAIIFLILGGISFEKYEREKTITIGVIADIHAGSQDVRDDSIEPNNILHPSNFETNLKKALNEMKGDDLIIALGDNTNTGSSKYGEMLKKITSPFPFVWVKGNHDTEESFAVLSPKKYYYTDKGKWRIVVLDNSESDPNAEITNNDAYDQKGYIDPDQMNWLKDALKTEKKIVISMHVPIFDRFNLDSATVYPQQENLVKLFEKSGNVKYVLSGHFHVYNFNREINGIQYYVLPSLELDGQEGYFATIKLNNE